MIHCRYLTAFDKPQNQLEASLYALMGDLDAVYDDIRLNPLNSHFELEAIANQSFEFTLTVHWHNDVALFTLIIFDVELATPVEPYKLDEALALPAATYFPPLTLVYSSLGRERSLRLFPRLLDLENSMRELIIAVMLKKFGSNWILLANPHERLAQGRHREPAENGARETMLSFSLSGRSTLRDA